MIFIFEVFFGLENGIVNKFELFRQCGDRHDIYNLGKYKYVTLDDYCMPELSAKTNNNPRNFGDKF